LLTVIDGLILFIPNQERRRYDLEKKTPGQIYCEDCLAVAGGSKAKIT